MEFFSTHNFLAVSYLSLFLSISFRLSAETLTTYTSYNEKGEVTNFVCETYSASWVYDQMGNRICSTLLNITNYYTVNDLNQYTIITNNRGECTSLQYDEDGNLTKDHIFKFEWDAENRLKRCYPVNIQNGVLLVENSYDYQHRRVKKEVFKLVDFDNSQPYSQTNGRFINEHTSRFTYVNNRMASEICVKSTGATNLTYYVWGADLSGELDGAGGVGGLLMVVKDGVSYYPNCDANGDIREYLDSNGLSVAQYVYNPFGEFIASCGTMKDSFSLRFSSKYYDKETAMYDYGRRFYHPWYGRWISRDPIEEGDGPGLYVFLTNDGVNKWDSNGLSGSLFRTINVPKCNITLFIGHQYYDARTIKWKFPDPDICAFGGDIGCAPGYNLPDNSKSWWPGQLTHFESIFNISRAVGLDKNNKTIEEFSTFGTGGHMDMTRDAEKILASMYSLNKFKHMYKSLYWGPCCCDSVKVNIIIGQDFEDDKKKEIYNLVKPFSTWAPGKTSIYQIDLNNRNDLRGEYRPRHPHF